jgi:formylglycine-generating enzyme
MKARIAVLLVCLASALPSFAAPTPGALLVAVEDPGAPPIALESDIDSLELRTDQITLSGGLGIRLKPEASDRMYEYTKANIGKSLAVVMDGKTVLEARIAEPIRGSIAVSDISPTLREAFALRFPMLLSILDGSEKALLSPGSSLLFVSEEGKAGEYAAAIAGGGSLKLHLEEGGYDRAGAQAVLDLIRTDAKSMGRLYETKNGLYLIYSLPMKDRSVPATLCSVRGLLGTVIVGMRLEVPGSDGAAAKCDKAEALFEAVLSRLAVPIASDKSGLAESAGAGAEPSPMSVKDMLSVPGGSYIAGKKENLYYGTPLRRVAVSGFDMSAFEVTQDLYRQVMGADPSSFQGDPKRPAEGMNWYEAVLFCNRLSERSGFRKAYAIKGTKVSCDWSANGYRLPTVAEWEYAAAGSDDSIAWYVENSGGETHPVGMKEPNKLGFHDMSGNVSEWCWDWESGFDLDSPTSLADPRGSDTGTRRSIKGGSWSSLGSQCDAESKDSGESSTGSPEVGFRIVRKP